jgi:hypothetical protein
MAKKNEETVMVPVDPPPPPPEVDPTPEPPEDTAGPVVTQPANLVSLKVPPDFSGNSISFDGEVIPIQGSGVNRGIDLDHTKHAVLVEQLQKHHGFTYVRG